MDTLQDEKTQNWNLLFVDRLMNYEALPIEDLLSPHTLLFIVWNVLWYNKNGKVHNFLLKSGCFLNFIYMYVSATLRSGLRVSLLLNRTSPISLLTATVTADIFLVISPLLPIRCIGIILAACQRRGFHLRGIRRRRLTQKQVSSLGKRLWSWNTVWDFPNLLFAFVDCG